MRPIVDAISRSDNSIVRVEEGTEGRTADAGAEDRAFDVIDELLLRARAIAAREPSRRTNTGIGSTLLHRIDACERRARRAATRTPALAPAAALTFVGEAIAVASIDHVWPEQASQRTIERLAAELDAAETDVAMNLFRSAIWTRESAQLPPTAALDFVLTLLADLGGIEGASLWQAETPGSTECVAAAGRAARSRRMCETARAALDGVPSDSSTFQSTIVERWDQPFAALVVRAARGAAGSTIEALLAEAAAALSPVLERDALYDRGATRERELVAANERRLVRLGFDLHDGPLQEIVAFAEDLRNARSHIEPLLDEVNRLRAAGCFDDLGTRLASLDRDLRQLAHSVRATTALERPLEEALRSEVDALTRYGVETDLDVTALPQDLTDSQKIVIYRVVQEALNNVRKHSGARIAHVGVRATRRLIEIVVSDDGCGIDRRILKRSDRLGLAGMHERVRLLGGVVTVGDGPSGGTLVFATLPRWRARTATSSATYAATA
jgi:signal transduction histidine kinase